MKHVQYFRSKGSSFGPVVSTQLHTLLFYGSSCCPTQLTTLWGKTFKEYWQKHSKKNIESREMREDYVSTLSFVDMLFFY